MSDLAQIVTAICSAITALGVPLIGWLLARQNAKQTQMLGAVTGKVQEVAVKADAVVAKVEKVEHATNGIKAELVAVTAQAARAEGKAEGVQEERERTKP